MRLLPIITLLAAFVGPVWADTMQPTNTLPTTVETEAPTDSLTAAIMEASQPDSPPVNLGDVQEAARQKAEAEAANNPPVVSLNATTLPTISGGSNKTLASYDAGTPAGPAIDRLVPATGEGEEIDPLIKERARIRLTGDFTARFRDTPLGIAIRAVADHAGMRYISAPSGNLKEPVTINGKYNPLDLLDILQQHYGVAMDYDRGIWRFDHNNPQKLSYQSYRIYNNSRETVEITSPTIQSSIGSSSEGSSSAGVGGGSGGNFAVSYDLLLKDVRDLLTVQAPGASKTEDAAAAAPQESGKVTYIPEANELLVLASDYHHGLIRDYLKRIDQPIPGIEFTAYFVETNTAPSQELGIDWSNAISSTVSGSSAAGDTKFSIPRATILNEFEFAAALNFTRNDSHSWVSQQPTVVGMPNRKTVLDATDQIPVAQSSTSNNATSAVTTTSELEYIDVGTVVNIFPVIVTAPDGSKRVRLHISLVVSSITGERVISGNPAPSTSRRRFEFSVEVPDKKTLVIGGLVSSSTTRSTTRVPFISAVPVVGRLFRTDSDNVTRTNMTAFITPRILSSDATLTQPADLPRVWPEDLSYKRPVFVSSGASLQTVISSLNGFSRELAALETYNNQARDPEVIVKRLKALQDELDGMKTTIKGLGRSGVDLDESYIEAVKRYSSRAAKLRLQLATQFRP